MQTRLYVLVFGIVYLVLGILGFFPAFYSAVPAGAPHLDITAFQGNLFGIFPVNVVHDIVHILLGLIAIGAGAHATSARLLSCTFFVLFGLITFLGFIPEINTFYGAMPIYGDDTWLNAATSVISAYFGFVAPAPSYVEPAAAHAH